MFNRSRDEVAGCINYFSLFHPGAGGPLFLGGVAKETRAGNAMEKQSGAREENRRGVDEVHRRSLNALARAKKPLAR